jgi:hypothetical protein
MSVNVAKDLMEIDIIERMNLLEREVAGQGAKLDAIQESIRRIAQSVDSPTNWTGIGALVIGAFTVCLTIMTLANSAVAEKANAVAIQMEKVLPSTYESRQHLIEVDDDLEEAKRDIKRLIEKTARIEALTGIK